MPRAPLTAVSAREVVYLLILEELGKVRDGEAAALIEAVIERSEQA